MVKQKQSEFHLFDFSVFDEICLIDDEPSFLFLNGMIFKITHPKIQQVSFHNTNDAFAHFQTNPDVKRLVVLDIHIGLTTGFELLDALNDLSLPNTNVMMHSTYPEDRFVQQAFSYQLVKVYVVKPLTIETVELLSGQGDLPENLGSYIDYIKLKG